MYLSKLASPNTPPPVPSASLKEVVSVWITVNFSFALFLGGDRFLEKRSLCQKWSPFHFTSREEPLGGVQVGRVDGGVAVVGREHLPHLLPSDGVGGDDDGHHDDGDDDDDSIQVGCLSRSSGET